jgi:hypothetical protein
MLICEEPYIRSLPTRDYLLWRCLPRPRDLIYLCYAALLNAGNARNSEVRELDIIAAEEEYSLFAFEALLVESDPYSGLTDILFEFAGRPATISTAGLHDILSSTNLAPADTVSTLLRASFLGIEISTERFVYPIDENSERRANVLARRHAGTDRAARYRVHPAYRPYLGITMMTCGRSVRNRTGPTMKSNWTSMKGPPSTIDLAAAGTVLWCRRTDWVLPARLAHRVV